MFIHPNARLTSHDKPPSSLIPWITYQDSLIEKLKTQTEDVSLQVLKQQWSSPDWWGKHVLQLEEERVFHREIVIWAKGKPCWYGRSIIPQSTYQRDVLCFERLQNETLGQLIFNNKNIKRVSFMHYEVGQQSIEYHWLNESMYGQTKILWVRLSEFMIHDHHPFFLLEILLPGLVERYAR